LDGRRRGRQVKYVQAVLSMCEDGRWKVTVQSDEKVERCLYANDFGEIQKELKDASIREWKRRSV
jgi:hypothetical protein